MTSISSTSRNTVNTDSNTVASDKAANTTKPDLSKTPTLDPYSKSSFEMASVKTVDTFANRPVASHPSPDQLKSDFHGLKPGTPSANQTGQINNAADMAQYVFAGYNGGKYGPVSIAPATIHQGGKDKQAYLVGISGTEGVPNQSTGWITNFKAGFMVNNPGLRNAKDAIFRSVPEGSNLVLAGHSQGGMIAQQLAADPDIKKHYNVVDTETFGSPLVNAGQREGEVHRIAARLDPVPQLSAQSVMLMPWARVGQQNVGTDSLNGITTHNNAYVNPQNSGMTAMDALGRQSPKERATITFDPNDRTFFTSPTKTKAPY